VAADARQGRFGKNLHLTIRMMQGEYNSGYPELEESLPPRDPYVIVDEEHNENAWPASVSNATVKFGRKSYAAPRWWWTAASMRAGLFAWATGEIR